MIAYLGCNYFHNIGNDMRYAVKEKKKYDYYYKFIHINMDI